MSIQGKRGRGRPECRCGKCQACRRRKLDAIPRALKFCRQNFGPADYCSCIAPALWADFSLREWGAEA